MRVFFKYFKTLVCKHLNMTQFYAKVLVQRGKTKCKIYNWILVLNNNTLIYEKLSELFMIKYSD